MKKSHVSKEQQSILDSIQRLNDQLAVASTSIAKTNLAKLIKILEKKLKG